MDKRSISQFFPRLLVSVLLLAGPLVSCSSDPESAQVVRAMSVPDDGYKPPAKNSKKLEKPKNKVVSFRTNDPLDI